MKDERIVVGGVYVDDVHGDTFTVEAIGEDGLPELDSGQWYELQGPEGLIAKLDTGVVRRVE